MKSYFTERMKHMRRSIWLNLFAAAINAAAFTNSVMSGGWVGWLNLPLVILGIYVAHLSWRRTKEIDREQRDYVEDVLRGKYG